MLQTQPTAQCVYTTKLLTAGPAQDRVRDACREYNDLVERDYRAIKATADEWFAVGRKLDAAADLLTGDRRYFVSSRAVDAHAQGRRVLLANCDTARAVARSFAV